MTTVIFDQNIISYGDIMRSGKIDNVLGFVRNPPPGIDGSWLRKEFDCLPTISKLLQDREIKGYRYIELELEDWQRSGSGNSANLGNLFPRELFGDIGPAIERSYFFQSSISDYVKTSKMVEFCLWLKRLKANELNLDVLIKKGFPAEMLRNLHHVSRFHELCHVLQKEEQLVDAFHLWSAEVNGIEYFLTTDKKFVNAIQRAVRDCKPILPSELLDKLGVRKMESFDYKVGVFYGIGGNHMQDLT